MRVKISELRAEIARLQRLKKVASDRAKRMLFKQKEDSDWSRDYHDQNVARIHARKLAEQKDAARTWERRCGLLLGELNLARARDHWRGPVPDEVTGEMIETPEMLAAILTSRGLRLDAAQLPDNCTTH